MSESLKERKEQSRKRRQLLALQLGLDNPDELGEALTTKQAALNNMTETDNSVVNIVTASVKSDKPAATTESLVDCEEEDKEEIFVDSSTFLKGTNSANPHNDYTQHFVDTGERPQNFIHDTGLANRFEEYPKLRELIKRKDELIASTNTPPMYLKCDLSTFDLQDLESKFDVIFVEPPLEEYKRTVGKVHDRCWSWEEVERLEIDKVAAPQSFLWLWCGSSDGLDAARRCMKRWGFRRCEDICWIKTNTKNPGHTKNIEPKALFQRTKEHCLMGIKGTVRRSTDGHLIHANVDIDIIIDEERAWGNDEKPVEIFHIMEHFCLGRRRLHIFGRDSTIRPGWVSVGDELTSSNFDPEQYNNAIHKEPGILTGCTEEIERLRPKSPPPKGAKNQAAQNNDGAANMRANNMGMMPDNNFGGPRMGGGMFPAFQGRGGNFGNRRGNQRGGMQQPRNF